MHRTRSFILTICLAVAPLASAASPANLSTTEQSLTQRLGGAILSAKVSELETAVYAASSAEPANAHKYVQLTLRSRTDADAIAPNIVTAAIRGLGENPHPRAVARIVYCAVKITPDAAVEIARAATLASPENCASEIIAAAVAGVPGPSKNLVYRKLREDPRLASAASSLDRDFKGEPIDYKDFKSPLEPIPEPTEDDVDRLYHIVSSARAISGVGDYGSSHYANEPNIQVPRKTDTPNVPPKQPVSN